MFAYRSNVENCELGPSAQFEPILPAPLVDELQVSLANYPRKAVLALCTSNAHETAQSTYVGAEPLVDVVLCFGTDDQSFGVCVTESLDYDEVFCELIDSFPWFEIQDAIARWWIANHPSAQILKLRALGGCYQVLSRLFHLGRSRNCDLCIPSEHVARRHAQVRLKGGAYWFCDGGSTNGSVLRRSGQSEVQIDEVQIQDGDVFVLGDVEIQCELVDARDKTK